MGAETYWTFSIAGETDTKSLSKSLAAAYGSRIDENNIDCWLLKYLSEDSLDGPGTDSEDSEPLLGGEDSATCLEPLPLALVLRLMNETLSPRKVWISSLVLGTGINNMKIHLVEHSVLTLKYLGHSPHKMTQ